MENTSKKATKPGLQLVISVLVATSLTLAELYVMINQPANVVLLVGIAVLVLIAVYFVIDAIVDCEKEKEIAIKEQYDNIYRSEKASYMFLKKKMGEFSDLIESTNDNNQEMNIEEIVSAQKSLAKFTVNKNRESVEMLATKIEQLEAVLESSLANAKTGGVDEEKQDRLFIELNNLEASLNDRIHALSDKLSGFQEEIERLADHIARINSEAISEAVSAASAVVEPTKEIVLMEDIPAVELTDDIVFTEVKPIDIVHEDELLGMSAFADESFEESYEDDALGLLEDVFAGMEEKETEEIETADDILNQLLEADVDALKELEKAFEEVVVEEPTVEEESVVVEEPKPAPIPAPADNGGKMGQDDIAALIASMTGGDVAPAAEPEPVVVEEPKPAPASAPADSGGKMNQDDIAALIASMTGN